MDSTKRHAAPNAMAVQQAILARNKDNKLIADRRERQEFWSSVMRGEKASKEQLQASELLGKSEADFMDKVVRMDMSLADIAARIGCQEPVIEGELASNRDATDQEPESA